MPSAQRRDAPRRGRQLASSRGVRGTASTRDAAGARGAGVSAGDTTGEWERTLKGPPLGRHSRAQHSEGLFPPRVWVVAAVFAVLTLWLFRRSGYPDDLASWWIAASLVADGQAHAIYAVDTTDFASYTGEAWAQQAELIRDVSPYPHPYVHIPLVAYVLSPLTHIMSFSTFATLGSAISGACIVVIVAASISLFTRSAPSTSALWLGSVALWLCAASQMSITLGQSSPFIYATIAMALALSERRPVIAGVLIGIAALIKITPVALIVVLVGFASRRRAGLVGLAVVSAGAVLTLLLVDNAVITAWRDTIAWMNSHTLAVPINASLDSLFAERTTLEVQVEAVPGTPAAATVLNGLYVLLVGLGLVLLMGTQSRYKCEISAVAILLVATSVSGVVWLHYGLVAFLPIAGVLILHRRYWVLGVLLLAYQPLGGHFVDMDTTPGALQWAPLALLVIPTVLLVVGEIMRSEGVSFRSVWRGMLAEIGGRPAPAPASAATPVPAAAPTPRPSAARPSASRPRYRRSGRPAESPPRRARR
nr:glycosyltransferase family 87 protein [Corynebacterium sp. TAE3-ERU30]